MTSWVRAFAAASLVALVACSGPSEASKGELEIWSSLPRQGSSKDVTDTIVNAINMAVDQRGDQVGGYRIVYKDLDDSTAAAGAWDAATEVRNANDAVASDKLVAYIGTFNVGAARLSIPILCLKGIVMVSPANTGIGLTKPFQDGEPEKHYPDGCKKNYARVIPNDSVQGDAGARWASRLGLTTVHILDDTEAYGRTIADVFEERASGYGLQVLGRDKIDGQATDYRDLAGRLTAAKPELIYYGGISLNNASTLWQDLRGTLPDVALMGPDGILDQEFVLGAGAAAEGTYITTVPIPPDRLTGKGADFIAKYESTYPDSPPDPYTVYGFEAADVILTAIERASAKGPKDIHALRSLVLDEVTSIRDYDGVLGTWSFDRDGDTTLKSVAGYVVRDGEIVFEAVID